MATKVEKPYYQFSKGINTEASLIAFPEGFSADEENYELYTDGSRRRRLGLALEVNGADYTLPVPAPVGGACRVHDWKNVGGFPNYNYKIIQVGTELHIYGDDPNTIFSVDKRFEVIDLTQRKVSTSTNAEVGTSLVDVSYGRGDAFIVGKHIEPFFIRFNINTNTLTLTQISIKERDFEGRDDGISNNTFPITLTTDHEYNLQNRGWTPALISTFFTGQAKYPSKAMAPWLGLKRTLTSSDAYDSDGVRVFSDAKLVAELFQDASAPQGHFIRNPFRPGSVSVNATSFVITDYTIGSWVPGSNNITVETDGAHGLIVNDEFDITGSYFSMTVLYGTEPVDYTWSFDGTWTVSAVPDTTHVTFVQVLPGTATSWTTPVPVTYGTLSSTYSNSNLTSPYRPTCTAFYAGRVWYAGTPYGKQAGRLYFSPIIESDAQYGKCYQQADPTDERISDLIPSDGGVVIIPEVGSVLKLLPYGSFLLVFATNGIWQIGGNSASGFFSAVSYSIRKISEQGCVSGISVVLAGDTPVYAGISDILAILQDPNSGLLVTQNLTANSIHTLYAGIPSRSNIQGTYDELTKRIIWLYKSDPSIQDFRYDKALVFHTVLGAFTKFQFFAGADGYVASVFCLNQSASVNKLKFVGIVGGRALIHIADMHATNYTDFTFTEQPAYIISGPETLGDASKHKYAGYVWVFSKKTETGYTTVGEDLVPTRESSTSIQARWDWSDRASAGKWGPSQEAYRHRRLYQPVNSLDTFDDGQPLIVTKNKVRGRGRALQIKLTAGSGKDSYIAGWHVKHDIHTEA